MVELLPRPPTAPKTVFEQIYYYVNLRDVPRLVSTLLSKCVASGKRLVTPFNVR